MFCVKCGAEIESSSRYCAKCGNPVAIKTEDLQNVQHTQMPPPQQRADASGDTGATKNIQYPPRTTQQPTTKNAKAHKAAKSRLGLFIIIAACVVVVAAVIAIVLILKGGRYDNNDSDDGRSGNIISDAGNNSNESDDGSNSGNNNSGAGNRPGYWLNEAPDAKTVETSLWEFNWDSIGEDEMLLSVSPSSNYILTADRSTMDVSRRLVYGANNMGWQVGHMSLYERQDDSYILKTYIDLDAERDPEFNDTMASSDETGISWSVDEMRVLITGGVGRGQQAYARMFAANIYLVDFSRQSIEKLTDYNFGETSVMLPQWNEKDKATFIRNEGMEVINLMSINLETGRQEILSNLSDEGRIVFMLDYQIYGDYVYYIKDSAILEASGFYRADLGAGGSDPVQLLSMQEVIEQYNLSSAYFADFFAIQISSDGRWACLTAQDKRIIVRDIPMADDPDNPQADPSSAISLITGLPWIPCHSVFLYDLENNRLTDPFTDNSLRPDVVMATAATFAPDGKSLLCAVFGDGGVWTTDSEKETTLYQIRVDDGSFDAMRIFKTDLMYYTPDKLVWLGDNTLLIRPFGGGPPPFYPVQLVKPAVFELFEVVSNVP